MQKRQGLDVGKCMLFFGARYKQASFWDQPESVGGTTAIFSHSTKKRDLYWLHLQDENVSFPVLRGQDFLISTKPQSGRAFTGMALP